MKKLITIAILTVTASAAMAQGIVTFANDSSTRFQTNSLGVGGNTNGNFVAPYTGSGTYYFELLTAPSTVSSVDSSLQQLLSGPWSDTGMLATNSGANGRVSAGTNSTIPANWAGGNQQAYIIVGWSANEGSTWATLAAELTGAALGGNNGAHTWTGGGLAVGGFVGATTIGNAESGGGSQSLPAFVLMSGAGNISQGSPVSTGTTLWVVAPPVPEPTTFALVGLGAAALMVFRRKK